MRRFEEPDRLALEQHLGGNRVLVNGSDPTCPPDEFDFQSGGHTMTGYCLRVLALKIIQFFCRRFEQKKKKDLYQSCSASGERSEELKRNERSSVDACRKAWSGAK